MLKIFFVEFDFNSLHYEVPVMVTSSGITRAVSVNFSGTGLFDLFHEGCFKYYVPDGHTKAAVYENKSIAKVLDDINNVVKMHIN